MHTHQQLGQLNGLQQMARHLLQSIPEDDCYRCFEATLPPLAWLYGRMVWLETYWIREVASQDDNMTARLRHLFQINITADEGLIRQLPPRDHLLAWAGELQDENLLRLANPTLLAGHPLVSSGALLPRLLQQGGMLLEQMLAQLAGRQLSLEHAYRVSKPLLACEPSQDHADVHKGHYRVGARDDVAALDNELPPNVVELHAFRIDRHPVSNGAWLNFIEADGYQRPEWWSEAGWQWRQQQPPHPLHWRQDEDGQWYGIGLNGPFDLLGEDAVLGIAWYEAEAYTNWVASLGGVWSGAVLQHEYQWEVAARSQAIRDYGRVWEWCANPFHRYTGYLEPADPEASTQDFDAGHFCLRGGSLHTQQAARRQSFRHHGAPEQRHLFCGTRLVFPASTMPWEK